MIVNPIISKELLHVLRSRTALVLALGFVVALSLLAVAMWPESGVNPVGALYSRLFFTVLFSGQLVMLALFSPPFSATAITAERETNTWDMLYFSLLRPRHILVGKLVGAVAFLLLLVTLSLPIGGTCFLLGGVSAREMFMAYAVLITAGISFGLFGLACSALFRSSFAAIIATYIAMLIICGGVHVPMLLLPEWRQGQAALHAIRCISPFTALVAVTQDAFRSMPGNASAGAVVRYFIYSGVLCAVLVAVVLVRVAMRPSGRPRKRLRAVDETTPLSIRIMRRIFFVVDPRRRRGSIPLWMNPVLILELRTRTAGIGNLLRAAFACLIFSILLVVLVSGTWGATRPDTIRLIALSFQIGLIALIGPSLTIGAIASEVESRTFDSLRMAPMSSWAIFAGKFGAAAILSVMLLVASMPVFLAIKYIEQVRAESILAALLAQPESLAAMVAVSCVTLVFALSCGLFFSSICRTTARAGAWAYGLMALVTTGTLLAFVLQDRLNERLVEFIVSFNPIVTVVGAVSEQQFARFGDWHRHVLTLGAITVLLILGTVYRLHRAAGPEE